MGREATGTGGGATGCGRVPVSGFAVCLLPADEDSLAGIRGRPFLRRAVIDEDVS
jgi:hypothetical protein